MAGVDPARAERLPDDGAPAARAWSEFSVKPRSRDIIELRGPRNPGKHRATPRPRTAAPWKATIHQRDGCGDLPQGERGDRRLPADVA
eukprot:7382886-Prymnesium_polylepis.2